jgi:hypothetical protein
MNFSISKTIRELAQLIDMPFDTFFNPETLEIIEIPDEDEMSAVDDTGELYKEAIEKVHAKNSSFILMESVEGFQGFKVMEAFARDLDNENFKQQLVDILDRPKPFSNFNRALDDSDYRQRWFNFKQNELEKFVEEQLEITLQPRSQNT